MTDFRGKRVVVAGLGASGFAAARGLLEKGADLIVTESSSTADIEERATWLRAHGAKVETGGHTLDGWDADLAVVSPGITPSSGIITALVSAGVPIVSEVELAYRLARCSFLAVTGTNGKTTTTALLAAMLAEGGIPSLAAGNIGLPLVDAIRQVPAEGAIAAEVSSFQLAYISTFRPRVAVILNIAEDHTDWHGTLDSYADAKARILENQTAGDVAIVNLDDELVMRISARARGTVITFSVTQYADARLADGALWWGAERVAGAGDIALSGRAGWEDALAALAAACSFGVDVAAARRALESFRPLHHRLERVAVFDGVTFIDDSKATNPHATLAAVSGLKDVVLIAGGRSKGIDMSALSGVVPPVTAVVAIGEAREEIARVLSGLVPVARASTMDEAVELAAGRAVFGGSVLLSPGCASLDMYTSYAERGEAFARAVRQLIGEGDGDGDA